VSGEVVSVQVVSGSPTSQGTGTVDDDESTGT